MGQYDGAGATPDLSKLREEFLAAITAAAVPFFDRVVEAAWRQGAEAAHAAAQAALVSLIGQSPHVPLATAKPVLPPLPERGAAPSPVPYPPAPAQAGLLPEPAPPKAKAPRANSGAVQEGVLAVLGRASEPLAPLAIVAAGRDMGIALKASSVGMALKALEKRGRVGRDGRLGFYLEPGGTTEGGLSPPANAPGVTTPNA